MWARTNPAASTKTRCPLRSHEVRAKHQPCRERTRSDPESYVGGKPPRVGIPTFTPRPALTVVRKRSVPSGRHPELVRFSSARRRGMKNRATANPHEFAAAHSSGMELIRSIATKVAASPTNVLIFGEAGAGKDVLARTIHKLPRGSRSQTCHRGVCATASRSRPSTSTSRRCERTSRTPLKAWLRSRMSPGARL